MRFVLLLTGWACAAYAASNGKLSYCDVDANFGCTEWVDGDRLQCADANPGLMYWAERPIRTDTYTLTSISGATYVPGQNVEIALSVNKYHCDEDDTVCYDDGWTYRGLLIYAEDSTGTKQGRFVFPTDSHVSSLFHQPPACPGALTHVNAEPKPLRVRLIFETPDEAGVGPLTFRALVKRGPANDGAFYIPNLEGDLVLGEAPTDRSGTFALQMLGTSVRACSEICADAGLLCRDASDVVPSGVTDALVDFGEVGIACPTPLLLDCGPTSPRAVFKRSDGNDVLDYCTYRDAARCDRARFDCFRRLSEASPTASMSRRLCPCVRSARRRNLQLSSSPHHRGLLRPDAAATEANDGEFVFSSAQRRAPNRLILVLVLVVTLPLLFSLGESHNWLITPSRSQRQASTLSPCIARRATDVHAQIGPGQEDDVVVKFATGHNKESYWLVVHEDDAEQLARDDLVDVIEDYVARAPSSSHTAYPRTHGVQEKVYQKNPAFYDNGGGGMYSGEVSPSAAPHYRSPSDRVFAYETSRLSEDRRVAYASDLYPWIESAAIYPHMYHLPKDHDAARLHVPHRNGAGHYIAYWRWKGYSDCVDIDVFDDNPVPQNAIYGVVENDFQWQRVDHCRFVEPKYIRTQCTTVSDPDDCVASMSAAFSRSTKNDLMRLGVSVVPSRTPATALASYPPPWSNWTCAASDVAQVCVDTADSDDLSGWTRCASRNNDCEGCDGDVRYGKHQDNLYTATVDSPSSVSFRCSLSAVGATFDPMDGRRGFCYCRSRAVKTASCAARDTSSSGLDWTQFESASARMRRHDGKRCAPGDLLWQWTVSFESAMLSCASDERCGYVVVDLTQSSSTDASVLSAADLARGSPVLAAACATGATLVTESTAPSSVVTFERRVPLPGSVTETATSAPSRTYRVNFAPETAVISTSASIDVGEVYSQSRGYGWNCDTSGLMKQLRDEPAATPENTGVEKIEKYCDDGRRRKWEINVVNGLYRVTTTHRGSNLRLRGCTFEGTRLTNANGNGAPNGTITIVREDVLVTDGKMTMAADPTYGLTNSQEGCRFVSEVKFERFGSANALDATTWISADESETNDAWFQRRVESDDGAAVSVGAVTIYPFGANADLQGRSTGGSSCRAWWMWRGGASCVVGNTPQGFFDDVATQGLEVSLTNRSCGSSVSCAPDPQRHVCAFESRVATLYEDPDKLGPVRVDCKGAYGRYLFVRLPGSDRVFDASRVEVALAAPVFTNEDAFVCFGVESRTQTETQSEYVVRLNPTDPIFYSTCYVREPSVTFLSSAETSSSSLPSYRVADQCLTCASFEGTSAIVTNASSFAVPRWIVEPDGGCIPCGELTDNLTMPSIDGEKLPETYDPSRSGESDSSSSSSGAAIVVGTVVAVVVVGALIVAGVWFYLRGRTRAGESTIQKPAFSTGGAGNTDSYVISTHNL